MSQGCKAVAATIVSDPRRSGHPSLQEEMAAGQDEALHSWYPGWRSPQCHQQPFLSVPVDTAMEDLIRSLLLPGERSRCLRKTLLWGSSDVHELLVS